MANGFDDELDDLFGDDDLPTPSVRGNANLDPQDYQRIGGPQDDSSFLDDDIQEDTPSRPGDGAGPAPDIDGVDDMDPFEAEDGPGMQQTDFGSHPWGPGSAQMYRPYSQARTDMSLGADETMEAMKPRARPSGGDSMLDEPEVPMARMNQQQNRMPSNRAVDPETLYDDDPYTFQDSSQATIGDGIFSMEEGVTWRSFWNGPKGTSGPISTTWNVHGWPTLYFLDHKGVIRARDVRDEAEMEKLIDDLLAEAKKDAGK